MAYCRKLSDECEGNADRFMRRSYLPLLTDVRKRLANLCKTDLGSVVLVPNATHVSPLFLPSRAHVNAALNRSVPDWSRRRESAL